MAFFRKINEQYMNELHCSKKNNNKVLRKERKNLTISKSSNEFNESVRPLMNDL